MHLLHSFGKGGMGGADWSVLRQKLGMLGSLFPPVFLFFSMITVNKSCCLLKPKVSLYMYLN